MMSQLSRTQLATMECNEYKSDKTNKFLSTKFSCENSKDISACNFLLLSISKPIIFSQLKLNSNNITITGKLNDITIECIL